MRRSAWIFLAAILLPSLVLAWMAVRSARDQQVILEHQQAIICQDITDALAKQVQDQVDSARLSFMQTTDQILRQEKNSYPLTWVTTFNRRLRSAWSLAEVGFVVDSRGVIYSPSPGEGLLARNFRDENDRFLSNLENAEVFAQTPSKKAQAVFIASQDEANQLSQAGVPSQASQPEIQSASE